MPKLSWTTITSLKNAPTTAGVYRYWSQDKLLYIGKAINLKARLASHAQAARLDARERAIVQGATRIEITEVDTEFKALLLEAELIRTLRPQYNRAWKDDKTYLYIVIDKRDRYPRPQFARAHDLQKFTHRECKLFGPFPSARVAESLLRSIRRLIPFCMQKRVGERPCFYSKLGLCSPCPATIKKLTDNQQARSIRQYRHQIRQVIRILEGNLEPVIQDFKKTIAKYSDSQDYEQALILRNKLTSFTRYIENSTFQASEASYNTSDTRIKSLINLLNPYFKTLTKLARIECYDASHSGTHSSTASMVVATNGLLDRGQYRRFKVKNPRATSDFARLSEAISRRLKRSGQDSWSSPDLIIIDGGAPQVRALERILDQLPDTPPYLGLAKRPDRLVLPDLSVIRPAANDPGFQLLQSLRDEAHRFANNYRKILDKRLSFNG